MRKFSILFVLLGLMAGVPTRAAALPIVISTSTALSDGSTQYSYVLDNSLGAESIFDFGLYYLGPVADASVSSPLGWSHVAPGYDEVTGQGYINWFSPMLEDGTSPSDLLAGATLGGFSFVSALGPGPITFTVNGALNDFGPTTGPNPAPVPEPGTLSLLALGAAGLLVHRRRGNVRA